ncbi:MAG: STAS domain-containing protein [Acidobacteria bacterium]|nr:STAS domain-containing protein [Acidobacteriota bacterium]
MDISERKVGRITVVNVQGQAIINAQPERLSQLVGNHLKSGERLFVVNLSDCYRMDSTGLGELIKSQKLVSDYEGVLKLACVPLRLRGLIVVTNLNEVLEIFDSEQAAINSFGA